MSDGGVVDVQKFLNAHRFSGFQWLIFALCFAIVFLDGFDTAAIGYIAPALVSEWAVEPSALAPVLTAALFGLSTGAFFAGPLGDRFGRKMVLVGSVFVFGTACLASAFSGDLVQLIIWRFITGLGLGAAMPNAVTGLSQGTAAVITALFALGCVWAILSGWLMDRFSANLTVAICFALTALGVWSIGQTGSHVALLASLVLIAGVLLNTAQTSLPSLAAAFYPTQGRATGVAWMMALGRFGGIAGSFLVAELARRNLSLGQIFTGMAVPGFIAGGALLVKQFLKREEKAVYSEAKL